MAVEPMETETGTVLEAPPYTEGRAALPLPPVGTTRPQPPKVARQGSVWSGMQSLLGTVVIAVFVITFVVQAFQIPSESMESTLLIGDYVLVDKMHYGGDGSALESVLPYRDIHRGDIVVFRYPVHPDQHFVKRVVGVQGDRIRLVDKQLFVNGTRVVEPYVQHLPNNTDAWRDNFPRLNFGGAGVEGDWYSEMRGLVRDNQLVVPEGHYFVMGDNRDQSSDSRYWGFVPRENVVGRPLLVYWSLRKLDDDEPPSNSLGDRIMHLAYVITKIPQTARWDRALRMIR